MSKASELQGLTSVANKKAKEEQTAKEKENKRKRSEFEKKVLPFVEEEYVRIIISLMTRLAKQGRNSTNFEIPGDNWKYERSQEFINIFVGILKNTLINDDFKVKTNFEIDRSGCGLDDEQHAYDIERCRCRKFYSINIEW